MYFYWDMTYCLYCIRMKQYSVFSCSARWNHAVFMDFIDSLAAISFPPSQVYSLFVSFSTLLEVIEQVYYLKSLPSPPRRAEFPRGAAGEAAECPAERRKTAEPAVQCDLCHRVVSGNESLLGFFNAQAR